MMIDDGFFDDNNEDEQLNMMVALIFCCLAKVGDSLRRPHAWAHPLLMKALTSNLILCDNDTKTDFTDNDGWP